MQSPIVSLHRNLSLVLEKKPNYIPNSIFFTLTLDQLAPNIPFFEIFTLCDQAPSPIKARSLFSIVDILNLFTYSAFLKLLFTDITSFQNSPKQNIHPISFNNKENNPEHIFHYDTQYHFLKNDLQIHCFKNACVL